MPENSSWQIDTEHIEEHSLWSMMCRRGPNEMRWCETVAGCCRRIERIRASVEQPLAPANRPSCRPGSARVRDKLLMARVSPGGEGAWRRPSAQVRGSHSRLPTVS